MLSFSDFPDLKLLQIINSNVSLASTENRKVRFRCPSNVLCIIESIFTKADSASVSIDSMIVDGVEMVRAGVTQGTTWQMYIQSIKAWLAPASVNDHQTMLIPMRKEIVFDITNTLAGANGFTAKIYAYVHNDDEENYQTEASHSTLQPST